MSQPALNRELSKAETIREAFKHMDVFALFRFNDRKRMLRVTEVRSGSLEATVRNRSGGTSHTFVWEGYDRPRHKPREDQTNKVKTLEVGSYGEAATQNSEITQELDYYLLGNKNVEVYDAGDWRSYVVGAVGSVKHHLDDAGYDVTVVSDRALEVQY